MPYSTAVPSTLACMKAIAAHRDTGPVRRGELGAEHAGDPESHRAEPHAADQRVRPARVAELQEPVVVDADIAHEDRSLGQRATDLVRGALRIDRGRIVAVTGRDRCFPFATPVLNHLEPGLPRRGCA